MVHAMQGRGERIVGCVKNAPIVNVGEQEGCLPAGVGWMGGRGQGTVREG